jgi:hypothetical protein
MERQIPHVQSLAHLDDSPVHDRDLRRATKAPRIVLRAAVAAAG